MMRPFPTVGDPPAAGGYPTGPQYTVAPQYTVEPQYIAAPPYIAEPQYTAEPQYAVTAPFTAAPEYPEPAEYPEYTTSSHAVPADGYATGYGMSAVQAPPAPEAPPAATPTPDGPVEAAGPASAKRPRRHLPFIRRHSAWRELLLLLAVVLVVSTSVKLFFVQAFYVPSGSMENTVQIGDRVVVDKLTPWFGSQPSRGEVVVFQDPGGWLDQPPAGSTNPFVSVLKKSLILVGLLPEDGQANLIKRVIGLPGDHVKCCDDQHRITVNGVPLTEPYLFPDDTPSLQAFDVTVPPGRLWVMGDHRSDSADSRSHIDSMFFGTVPESNVVGRAVAIIWPFSRIGTLSIPATFNQNFAAGPAGIPGPPADPATASVVISSGFMLVRWRRQARAGVPVELLGRRPPSFARAGPWSIADSSWRGLERVMVRITPRSGRRSGSA